MAIDLGRRAVWTDFGGVLTPPVAHTMSRFCRRIGVSPDAFQKAMREVGAQFGTDPMAPLDTPLITEDQWRLRIEAVLLASSGIRVDLRDFGETWFADRETNQPWIARLHQARADGALVGMLSNMPPAWDARWRRMVPPGDLFNEVVLSFQVGHRKPERAIFDHAAKRIGVEPARCVLVDDLAANCSGAVEAGWHAIHLTGTGAAITELDRWLAHDREPSG